MPQSFACPQKVRQVSPTKANFIIFIMLKFLLTVFQLLILMLISFHNVSQLRLAEARSYTLSQKYSKVVHCNTVLTYMLLSAHCVGIVGLVHQTGRYQLCFMVTQGNSYYGFAHYLVTVLSWSNDISIPFANFLHINKLFQT